MSHARRSVLTVHGKSWFLIEFLFFLSFDFVLVLFLLGDGGAALKTGGPVGNAGGALGSTAVNEFWQLGQLIVLPM